jgi:hypothetical protein
MRTWSPVWVAFLLAGCAGPPPDTGADPDGSSAIPPDGNGTAPPTAPPDGTGAAEPAPSELGPTTWYPHTMLGCNTKDTLCNCGTVVQYMDRADIDDHCDGHGRTTAAPVYDGACPGECWPGEDMPPYQPGATVDAALFVTTDAADVCSFTLTLFDGEQALGSGHANDIVFVGAGGATYEEVPIRFVLDHAAPADPTMVLASDCNVAYFIGYDGDHTTRFDFTP